MQSSKQSTSLSEELCVPARDLHQMGLVFPSRRALPQDSNHFSQSFACSSGLTAHGLGYLEVQIGAEEGKPRGTPSLGEVCIHPGLRLSSAAALWFPKLPKVSLTQV